MDSDLQQKLVEAARGGSPEAWEALYREIYPRLRSYISSRVHASAVDDVMNETMTRAVGGIDGFRWSDAGFNGWLFGIARRASADHHRGAARARRRPPPGGTDASEELPGDALERSEEHDRVRAAFERLGKADREILELRVIAGLSAEEAAAVVGKKPGTVRTAQSRALVRLRQIVEREQ